MRQRHELIAEMPGTRRDGPAFDCAAVADNDRVAMQRHRGTNMPWHTKQAVAHLKIGSALVFHDKVFLAVRNTPSTRRIQKMNSRMRVFRRNRLMAEIE